MEINVVDGELEVEFVDVTYLRDENRRYLYAGAENALAEDGPISTLDNGSPARLLEYDLDSKRLLREFVYCVSPIPKPGDFGDNGLVELQALDNVGTFLAMERSWALQPGNTIRLFETLIYGANDLSGETALDRENCQPSEMGGYAKGTDSRFRR